MVDTVDSKIPCGTTELHASRLCTNALTKDSKAAAATRTQEPVLSRPARPVAKSISSKMTATSVTIRPAVMRRRVIGVVGAEGGYQQYPARAGEAAV